MKVNIYYGGRGVLDDPTLYVLGKIEEVLDELRVKYERFNLYEQKNLITTLPQTIKDADAIVLATTVEWLGLGGYMYQFLDALWLYGDKEKIRETYMQPIVMSTTYGEKEGKLHLENAWEMLGGLPCSGLCGYVENFADFELNKEYAQIIEKKAENLYRTISQKQKDLPTSNQAITRNVTKTAKLELTPKESEKLSEYVADDEYVRQQKEDIRELSEKFKSLMGQNDVPSDEEYIKDFINAYKPGAPDRKRSFAFVIEGKKLPLSIKIDGDSCRCVYEQEKEEADIYVKAAQSVIDAIVDGRETFQRAFMTGEISVKGNFKYWGEMDDIFIFG